MNSWQFFCLALKSLLITSLFLNSKSLALSNKESLSAASPSGKALLEKALATLPDRKLALDTVIRYGLTSQSFQMIIKEGATSNYAEQKFAGQFDSKLLLKAGQLHEKAKPQNAFASAGKDVTSVSVGVEKAFLTGTYLSAELSQNDIASKSSGIKTGNPAFDAMLVDQEWNQSQLSFSLKQSLWKNAFGSSFRATEKALEKNSQWQKLMVERASTQWFQSISQIFYTSWLLQVQYRALQLDVERYQRFLKITQVKARVGTAESSEVLQMESALQVAQQNKEDVHLNLKSIWSNLIVNLGLPTEWNEIDPLDIPIVLDNHHEDHLKICRQKTLNANETNKSLKLEVAELQRDSAENLHESSLSNAKPDFYFLAQLKNTGTHEERSESEKEMWQGKYPTTYLGVGLEFPLGFTAERAEATKTFIDSERAKTQVQNIKDQESIELNLLCAEAEKKSQQLKIFADILKMQSKRAQNDERRFQLGRLPSFQVMQTLAELNQSSLMAQKSEVDYRKATWQIADVKRLIPEYLKGLGTP